MISDGSKGLLSACQDANLAFSSSRACEKFSLLSPELLWLMRCSREVILSTIPGAIVAVVYREVQVRDCDVGVRELLAQLRS